MKILVTGSNGQLGNEIRMRAGDHPGYEFLFTDLAELDITDEDAIESMIASKKIRTIINCAAYTAVDKAEQEEAMAYLINATAVGNLARVAARHGALLIHISTDYVYDGKGYRPYLEDDEPGPVSVYAKSKLWGEEEIQSCDCKALIIRTSWLYSAFGGNFVKTIMKLGKEKGEARVISDQVGTPTYAGDLAEAIMYIIDNQPAPQGFEIFNYSNEGVASWYDFAKAIIEFSGISCKITPIETKEFLLPAARPFYSVFNKSKIKNRYQLVIPYWRDSLKSCIERMGG